MTKLTGKMVIVLLMVTLGLWGCAKGPANTSNQAEKIHNLENKCAKLEEDYRAVAVTRDDARKKLTTLDEEYKRLQKQFDLQLHREKEVNQLLVKERDELRLQIEVRTSERDFVLGRCDRLKKGLQELLGQDAAYLAAPAQTAPTNAPVLGN